MSQLYTKQLEATVGGVVALIAVVTGIAYARQMSNKSENTKELIGTTNSLAPNPNGALAPNLNGPIPQPNNPIPQPNNPLPNQNGAQDGLLPNPNGPLAPNPNDLQGDPLPNPNDLQGGPLPNPNAGPIAFPPVPHIQGEIYQSRSSGNTIGRATLLQSYNPGDIIPIFVNGAFHANVSMPDVSQSGNDIYFDPTHHQETDDPIFTLPRPDWLHDDEGENKQNEEGGLSPRLRADGEHPRTSLRPDLRGDYDGPPPRSLASLSGANYGDPVLSDLSESGIDQRKKGLGVPSSQESGFISSQESGYGSSGGKKTKTKKSTKKTRKHHRILNQVKKLLKEI